MKEKLFWTTVGVVVGLVAAPQLRKLPLVDKLPEI